jgi:protein translocase SecG subunit
LNPILAAVAATPAHAATLPLAAPKTGASPLILPPSAVQTAPLLPNPQTTLAAHAPWLTHGIAGLFVLAAVGLIVLLALQTTKQEGLSGTIGGRVEGAYRGRPGAEEQLKRLTGGFAVTFVVCAFILSLTGI